MSVQTKIQAHPDSMSWPATAAVLTFDVAGRPDRILIKNGREVVHDVPAKKITRLEGKPRGSLFTLLVEHPDGTARRTVVDALLRFGIRPQNRDDVVVDSILLSSAKGPAYNKYLFWHRRP